MTGGGQSSCPHGPMYRAGLTGQGGTVGCPKHPQRGWDSVGTTAFWSCSLENFLWGNIHKAFWKENYPGNSLGKRCALYMRQSLSWHFNYMETSCDLHTSETTFQWEALPDKVSMAQCGRHYGSLNKNCFRMLEMRNYIF